MVWSFQVCEKLVGMEEVRAGFVYRYYSEGM